MKAKTSPTATRTELTDTELVIAIAAGELTSLGLLFDRYHGDVRRLLSRIGVAASDLDDLVQQTFLEVLRASVRFRTDAKVRPWLYGLATVVAHRQRRSLSRMFTRLQQWAREPKGERVPTPFEECERGREAQRARRALEALTAKKREAFVLVVLEGMSCAEAAEALDTPVATVWTRVHYARVELRRLLGEEEP
jgi:RNA polymerase sigma-70 factor (ECF subfamily)